MLVLTLSSRYVRPAPPAPGMHACTHARTSPPKRASLTASSAGPVRLGPPTTVASPYKSRFRPSFHHGT